MAMATAQTIYFDAEKSRVVVEQKMTDLGKSKQEIYNSLKYFISNRFKGGSNVIDLDDYEKGIIITRATFSAVAFPTYDFNLIIRFRDNELMWTMTDIFNPNEFVMGKQTKILDTEKDLQYNKRNMMRIAFEIRDGINNGLSKSFSEDW
jgi:hypothetical protein